MFCGGCFRDNALVAELRKQGHHALLVPLYLPLTLDEPDQSIGTPIFFGGINVFLEQVIPWFRKSPAWVHRLLNAPWLLNLASGSAAKTRPEDVGELTLSMLRGEEGNQAREVEELVTWLRDHEKPDVICLSNVLLAGLARRLKAELKVPVLCVLQGEDWFLDALPKATRESAWAVLRERVKDLDGVIAPSRYFADLMQSRLNLPPDKVRVIHNGISVEGYSPAAQPPDPPVVGYFSRLCAVKGLDLAVDAFIELKRRGKIPGLRFKAGGGMSPNDEKFVAEQKQKLEKAGVSADTEWHPNVDRAEKIEFLRSFTVMTAPAMYGEAFGLYLIEAMAAGVPVVQPRHAAFPEIIEHTGGGLLSADASAKSLAVAIEQVLTTPGLRDQLSQTGRQAVLERFTVREMARQVHAAFVEVTAGRQSVGAR